MGFNAKSRETPLENESYFDSEFETNLPTPIEASVRRPELFDPNQPYRYRKHAKFIIQNRGNLPPIISWSTHRHIETTKQQLREAYDRPLFALDQSFVAPASEELNNIETAIAANDSDINAFWTESDNPARPHGRFTHELAFAIGHLAPADRSLLAEAFLQDEAIEVNLVHGPKHKITRFGDTVHRYDRPLPKEYDEYKFAGSNYALFTTVALARDPATNNLQLRETLLAELNLGSKTGNAIAKRALGYNPRNPYDTESVPLKRDLNSLVRRHYYGTESDPDYLTPPEFLYNQFAFLHDEVPPNEKPWVREALIDFITSELRQRNFRPRETKLPRFKIGVSGDVVCDQTYQPDAHRGNGNGKHYDPALRLNVQRGGYLEHVLTEINNYAHKRARVEKLTHFKEAVYPAFKAVWQKDPHLLPAERIQALVEQITDREPVRNRLLKSRGKNLDYLLCCFATDPDILTSPTDKLKGATLVRQLCAALHSWEEGQALAELSRRGSLRQDWLEHQTNRARRTIQHRWDKVTARIIDTLKDRNYFKLKERPTWIDEMDVFALQRPYYHPHRRKIPGPLFGVNPNHLLFPEEDSCIPVDAKLERPHHIASYDILPPRHTLAQAQEELARMFIEYVRILDVEDRNPSVHTVDSDSESRILRGRETSGHYLMVRSRTLFGENHAQQLFDLARRLCRTELKSDPQRQQLEQRLDFQTVSEVTRYARSTSSTMGEVFADIAIQTDPARMLGLPETIREDLEFTTTFAQHSSKGHYQAAATLNHNLSHDHTKLIPDLIVECQDRATGELDQILVEVKTFVDQFGINDAHKLLTKYKPTLTSHRLAIIINSPRGISEAAQAELTHPRITVVQHETVMQILDSEAVTRRYPTPTGEPLADYYHRLAKHPLAFGEDPDNLNYVLGKYKFLTQLSTKLGELFNADDLSADQVSYTNHPRFRKPKRKPQATPTPENPDRPNPATILFESV